MTTIYLNNQGVGIGELTGRIYKKSVSKKIHFFRKLNSWGMDKNVIDDLGDEVEIQIFDRDEKKTYISTAKQFREEGIQGNYGHGEQIFLDIYKFDVLRKK